MYEKDKTVSANVVALKDRMPASNSSHAAPQRRRGVFVETLPHGQIKFIPVPQTRDQ